MMALLLVLQRRQCRTGIDVDFDVASGIATISASGGSQRQVKVGVTTIIPNVAVAHTDIIGFKATP